MLLGLMVMSGQRVDLMDELQLAIRQGGLIDQTHTPARSGRLDLIPARAGRNDVPGGEDDDPRMALIESCGGRVFSGVSTP